RRRDGRRPRPVRERVPALEAGSVVSTPTPTPDTNDLIRQRLEKLESLRGRGLDPFGARFPVTHWAGPLGARLGQATEDELKAVGPVSVAGRVVSMRHHGKTCFAHLMD